MPEPLDFERKVRPKEYKSWVVPEILFSGDQKKIEKWRMEKSLELTKKKRPDLL